jgi:CubicO group peptidase (beta-lactamase class C family)
MWPSCGPASGYTGFDDCLQGQTVAECQSYQGTLIHNGAYVSANDGKFFYSGGHMQKHATLASVGLGPDDNAALASHIASGLGGGITLAYTQPQLAGGAYTSATDYGRFLQRVVAGSLRISGLLGTHAVCTNPITCDTAVATPIPQQESWHYSIGHWVEDDPLTGDGAVSSPGAFGFYPWIDASRHWWGVLARYSTNGTGNADPALRPYVQSVVCGRQIRAAWLDATARTTR